MQEIQNCLRISAKQNSFEPSGKALTIAVSSGKGGTGKTNVVANLAFAFTQLHKKVLILDGNLGLSNIGGLLGLAGPYTVEHVLNNQKTAAQVLIEGPGGMLILPGSSGNEKLTNPNADEKLFLLGELEHISRDIDVLLIDTAAGVSSDVLFFDSIVGDLIVVMAAELTSVSAAYNLIKILFSKFRKKRFNILVNMVESETQAREVFKMIARLSDAHLGNVSLDYLGFIPFDERLKRAVEKQKLVAETYPHAPSSKRFMEIATYLMDARVRAP